MNENFKEFKDVNVILILQEDKAKNEINTVQLSGITEGGVG